MVLFTNSLKLDQQKVWPSIEHCFGGMQSAQRNLVISWSRMQSHEMAALCVCPMELWVIHATRASVSMRIHRMTGLKVSSTPSCVHLQSQEYSTYVIGNSNLQLMAPSCTDPKPTYNTTLYQWTLCPIPASVLNLAHVQNSLKGKLVRTCFVCSVASFTPSGDNTQL